MYDYAYAAASLFFAFVWLICFVTLRRNRQSIFWTGLVFAPAGPFSEFWHLKDYWHPIYLVNISIHQWQFGIEDYLTTFSLAGISAGIFEYFALRRGFAALPPFSKRAFFKMHGWGIFGLCLMALFASMLNICSIHAILLTVAIASFLLLFGRWKLFLLVLPLALGLGIFYWLFLVLIFMPAFPGVIPALWKLETTWGIMLGGVPVEEFLWGFCIMLFSGPIIRICSTPKANSL